MGADFAIERVNLAIAVALLMIGAVMALSSSNALKRVAGLMVTQIAVLIGLAVLGAPGSALLAGLVLGFAQLVLGAGLLVRLQEAYGGVETADFDAIDEQGEPTETGA